MIQSPDTFANSPRFPVSMDGQVKSKAIEEKILVSVRVRPLNDKELNKNDFSAWSCVDEKTIAHVTYNMIERAGYPQAYVFDHVFGAQSTTAEVYEKAARDVSLSAMTGKNATIFAYGQTSSGKTYTMHGITENATEDIFQYIEQHTDRVFHLKFSALEIYNEVVNDLLNPDSGPLRLLDDPEKGTIVEGIVEKVVEDKEHLHSLLDFCEAHRQVGETALNDISSRSHQIIRLTVESFPQVVTDDKPFKSLIAVLNFIDLAGSERASLSQSEGTRLKEGCYINRSLLTLSTVIRKLSEPSRTKAGHVPYRDSKLTRILQNSLGGNARTAIICTMSPSNRHVEQTRNTLFFASCAKLVTNRAQVNMVISDKELIKQLKREIALLEAKLQLSNFSLRSQPDDLILEKDIQIQKMQDEMRRVTQQRDFVQLQLNNVLKRMEDMEQERHSDVRKVDAGDTSVSSSPSPVGHSFNSKVDAADISVPSSPSPIGHFFHRKVDVLDTSMPSSPSPVGHFFHSKVDVVDTSVSSSPSPIGNFFHSKVDVANTSCSSSTDIGLDQDSYVCDNYNEETQEKQMEGGIRSFPGNRKPRFSDRASDILLQEIHKLENLQNELAQDANQALEAVEKEVECLFQSNINKESADNNAMLQEEICEIYDSRLSEQSSEDYPITKDLVIEESRTSTPVKDEASWEVAEDNRKREDRNADNNLEKMHKSRHDLSEKHCLPVVPITGIKCHKPQDEEKNFKSARSSLDASQKPFGACKNDSLVLDKVTPPQTGNNNQELDKVNPPQGGKNNQVLDKVAPPQADLQEKVAELQRQKELLMSRVSELEKQEADGADSAFSILSPSPQKWKSDFEMKKKEIFILWDACHVSIMHRSQFYLLFNGDPTDVMYLEVELRRLTWLRDHQLKLNSKPEFIVQEEHMASPRSSLRRLRREREALIKYLKSSLTDAERDEIYKQWGIPLNAKQRKTKLAYLVWTNPHSEDHVKMSADLVARLVRLWDRTGPASKEMFQLSFSPLSNERSWLRSNSVSSLFSF